MQQSNFKSAKNPVIFFQGEFIFMSSNQDLSSQIFIAPYIDLEPHFKRGAIIVVEPGLSLDLVGTVIAEDNKTLAEKWLQNGQISKANLNDYNAWKTQKQFFKVLIIQPFVLVQEFKKLASSVAN